MCYHNLQAIQYGREMSYVTLIWSLIKCELMTKFIVQLKIDMDLY